MTQYQVQKAAQTATSRARQTAYDTQDQQSEAVVQKARESVTRARSVLAEAEEFLTRTA